MSWSTRQNANGSQVWNRKPPVGRVTHCCQGDRLSPELDVMCTISIHLEVPVFVSSERKLRIPRVSIGNQWLARREAAGREEPPRCERERLEMRRRAAAFRLLALTGLGCNCVCQTWRFPRLLTEHKVFRKCVHRKHPTRNSQAINLALAESSSDSTVQVPVRVSDLDSKKIATDKSKRTTVVWNVRLIEIKSNFPRSCRIHSARPSYLPCASRLASGNVEDSATYSFVNQSLMLKIFDGSSETSRAELDMQKNEWTSKFWNSSRKFFPFHPRTLNLFLTDKTGLGCRTWMRSLRLADESYRQQPDCLTGIRWWLRGVKFTH